jgi:hypothetical protein
MALIQWLQKQQKQPQQILFFDGKAKKAAATP